MVLEKGRRKEGYSGARGQALEAGREDLFWDRLRRWDQQVAKEKAGGTLEVRLLTPGPLCKDLSEVASGDRFFGNGEGEGRFSVLSLCTKILGNPLKMSWQGR